MLFRYYKEMEIFLAAMKPASVIKREHQLKLTFPGQMVAARSFCTSVLDQV